MAQIQVYGAPWCPDCRRTKKFLGEHRVEYDWIDIDEDAAGLRIVEELQRGGRSIPTLVFADGSHVVEPSNEELARKLGLNLEADRGFYDLAIIGGGPAGLAAAIYAAREGIETIVIDGGSLGGQAGVTQQIDNYPGFPDGIGGADLADRFTRQAQRYGVELLEAVAVEGLRPETGGEDVSLVLGTGQEVCAHVVLIATGSSYRRLGVPGEDELIGSAVHFCATCDGPFYRGAEELLVIGGGNSALEEGLFLAQFADRIRIVERNPELRASQLLRDKVEGHPKFEIHTNTEVVELLGAGGKLREVVARDRATGEEHRWRPAGAFVFIGLTPNSGFLEGAVDLDEWGFVTARHFETSLPGAFVAGDVRSGSTKQLGAATGDGIAALIAIRDYLQQHHHLKAVAVNA
jgi:thioredoxin reductase (NADPH)